MTRALDKGEEKPRGPISAQPYSWFHSCDAYVVNSGPIGGCRAGARNPRTVAIRDSGSGGVKMLLFATVAKTCNVGVPRNELTQGRDGMEVACLDGESGDHGPARGTGVTFFRATGGA